MSKQSEAKQAQGYDLKPVARVCANCEHRTFDLEFPFWMRLEMSRGVVFDGPREQETNQRCGIGGFAIKKTATCVRWAPKV